MSVTDEKDFWDKIEVSYPIYPTVRHRKRFIVNSIAKYAKKDSFIFDYGCGTGDILWDIKNKIHHNDKLFGGCDTSEKSVKICQNKFKDAFFTTDTAPKLEKKCDIIFCSEVIEHVREYKGILEWISNNIKSDGTLVLSTQAGKMYKIDEYSGHVHTFKLKTLKKDLEALGFEISSARLWGWPFFWLQKYLTNYKFDTIQNNFLEGKPSLKRRLFFQVIYTAYFIHDLIPAGPQIYIVARKK